MYLKIYYVTFNSSLEGGRKGYLDDDLGYNQSLSWFLFVFVGHLEATIFI